jgi:5-methylcytosine-specific restriction endonuclease McrA
MTGLLLPKPESLKTHRARQRRAKAKAMRLARAVVMPEGTRCRCGRLATQAHHVRPRSLGGQHTVENLEPLCTPCHAQIHGHR